MKLSKQILRRILIPVTVIVSIWTVGFYYAMIDEVEDEVDDSLDLYAEQIIRKQLRGEEVPTEDNATNNSCCSNPAIVTELKANQDSSTKEGEQECHKQAK